MMTRTRKFSDIAGYAMIYSLTALAFIPLVAFIVYLIAKGIGRIFAKHANNRDLCGKNGCLHAASREQHLFGGNRDR